MGVRGERIMTQYTLPVQRERRAAAPDTVYTVASGDLRLSANVKCWPTQQGLEADFAAAVERLGRSVERGHGASTR